MLPIPIPSSSGYLKSFPWFDSIVPIIKSPEILQLQSRVDLLGRELGKTMLKLPLDGGPCFSVETLEEGLKQSMESARASILPDEFVLSELRKCGNKHFNLVEMAYVRKYIEIPALNIPLPRCVSSSQIFSFLQRKASDVFVKWDKLKTLKREFQGAGLFLEDPTAAEHLREIDNAIAKAFGEPKASIDLGLSTEMLNWLAEIKKKGRYLMVRSTGAEDSKQMANAGGNISKAYVPPTPEAVCKAIGEVVRSYFAAPSLQNRLNGKINPFEEELSLAVTVQELIGEPVGGTFTPSEIPVSFVLWSNVPLFVGNEKFRAMRLSATYGHGESVVGNKGVGTDSILILQSEMHPDQIYYLYNSQKKPKRLAPVRKGEEVVLEKIDNPKELQENPALDPKQILDIYRSGILMEAFFKDPTDIEGVVLNGQVHFVQARPVNKKPALPTYLKSGDGIAATLQTETLVAGKASVVTIEKPEELLFTETLEEAEDRFIADQHKLIAVAQSEPDNSHPVTNFDFLQIPCFYASDSEAIQALMQRIDREHPLAVCTQTGTLNLWDKKLGKLEDQIVEGFAVHPAKIAVSLAVPEVLLHEEGVLHIPASIFTRIRSGDGLAALSEFERQPQLLYLKSKLAHLPKGPLPQAVQNRIAVLKSLETQISRAIVEMRSCLQTHPQDRLRRLLHAKILETLLKGPKTDSLLGRYYLTDVEPICRSIQTLMDYQKKLPFPSHCIDLLLDGQVSKEALPHWQRFLSRLEPLIEEKVITQEEWAEFQKIIGALKKTGAMPFYLTFFQENMKAATESTLVGLFREMLKQNGPEDQKRMGEAIQIQDAIRQMAGSIEQFADPKSFADAAKEFQRIKLIRPDIVKAASPMTQSIIYKVMEEKIALLDTAAKTLKKSQQIPPEERTALFKNMLLKSYYPMMEELAVAHVPLGAIPMHSNWALDPYLAEIRSCFDGMPDNDPAQLLPSRGFSVSAAMLGAGTQFSRHLPLTLEDMLTLLHQNSLACINILNQRLVSAEQIQQSLLPQAVKEAMALVEKTTKWSRGVQRLGIEIGKKEIVLRYNLPLRNHSGHLDLHYDLASGKMTLKGQLLGPARARWGETVDWINALETAGLYTSKRPLSQTAQELTFYWDVSQENLASALNDYANMAEYSLGRNQGFFNLVQRLSSQPELLEKISQSRFSAYNPRWLPFYSDYIAERTNLALAINAAKRWSGNPKRGDEFRAGIVLFREMVRKGQAFEPAAEAAQFAMENSLSIKEGLELFKELVEQGQAIEAAILAVKQKTSMASIDDEPLAKLNLVMELVKQGHAFEIGMQTAQSAMNDPSYFVEGLELFKELVKQGQAIEAAILAVNDGSITTTSQEYVIAKLALTTELVQRGQEIEAAIKVARATFDKDPRSVEALFSELFKQGQGFEAATEVATANCEHNLIENRIFALRLLEELVRYGHAFEPAIEAAKSAFKANLWVDTGRELFEELFKQGSGFQAAREAIRSAISNSDSSDPRRVSNANKLSESLLKVGQWYY